jgi:hypothetical protein
MENAPVETSAGAFEFLTIAGYHCKLDNLVPGCRSIQGIVSAGCDPLIELDNRRKSAIFAVTKEPFRMNS